jgi:hypothetical protein
MLRLRLAVIAAALLVGGCDDQETAPRDVTPPAAPRGVYSVTGDGAVTVHWLANTEGDVAGYRIYEAPCASGSTCPYDRVGVTTGTSFIVSGLTNGTTRYFAVAAYDRAGNESPLSRQDVYDTPRPAGFGLTLGDYSVSPATSGYDFSTYTVRAFDNANTDIFYGYNGTIHMMFAAFSDVFIQDAGYTSSLDDVDFAPRAPTDGWSGDGAVELIVGHSYVCAIESGVAGTYNYAKFRVTSLSTSPPRVVLNWAYQTAVDNGELKARPVATANARERRPVVWLR